MTLKIQKNNMGSMLMHNKHNALPRVSFCTTHVQVLCGRLVCIARTHMRHTPSGCIGWHELRLFLWASSRHLTYAYYISTVNVLRSFRYCSSCMYMYVHKHTCMYVHVWCLQVHSRHGDISLFYFTKRFCVFKRWVLRSYSNSLFPSADCIY